MEENNHMNTGQNNATESNVQFSTDDTRELIQRLQAAGEVSAPASLLPTVLAHLGLPATNERDISLDSDLALAYYNKGNNFYSLGRYEEALAAYEKVTQLDPNLTSIYNDKGHTLYNLKQYEEALAAYKQALRLNPKDAIAYNGKGNALYSLQRYEEALAAYKQALRLDPKESSVALSIFSTPDNPANMPEIWFVELAQAGSEAAFKTLYHRYSAPIHRYLTALVGKDQYIVEDLVQETFFKVWNGLPTLRDSSRFEQWLFRIASNRAIDYDRRIQETELTLEKVSKKLETHTHLNAKQIWQAILEKVQSRVSPAVYTTWFQGTAAISYQDSIFFVRVPTTFAKAHLEGRFLDLIRSILSEVISKQVDVRFVVARENPSQISDPVEETPFVSSKRGYRIPKSRLTPLQREKSRLDSSLSATSSSGQSIPQVSAHRRVENDEFAAHESSLEEYDRYPDKRDLSNVSRNTQPGLLPLPLSGQGLLNPRYTFGSFIMGKSNQLAHAASLAVAENPGRVYNPLFFYGGVGLGKTHLLHAIGHVGELAGLNVLYVTSEKFTNEIINAIRFQQTEEFRAKYRQIDILLIDDIQFIAGKESTEEEFFHTFNTLYNANKQIVVSSDRPPKAIHSLQDRLRSRFEWGLLADIQPPEYEHRLAILRSKAESLRFAVPASVIEFVARPECNSVRELEGALNRVIAYATLHDAALSVNLAAQALEHINSESKVPSNLTPTEVLEGVCRYYNVDIERIRGKQREREIIWPRQVAMYLMRQETSASLLQIGSELGGRDHTTVMHGWEKIQGLVANNDNVRREIAAVLESLQRKE